MGSAKYEKYTKVTNFCELDLSSIGKGKLIPTI